MKATGGLCYTCVVFVLLVSWERRVVMCAACPQLMYIAGNRDYPYVEGLYLLQPTSPPTHQVSPPYTYQHACNQLYMYYERSTASWWIGPELDAPYGYVLSHTTSVTPDSTTAPWRYWDEPEGRWLYDMEAKLVCLHISCQRFTMSSFPRLPTYISGEFHLTEVIYNGRPVYQNAGSGVFLYHQRLGESCHAWLLGAWVGDEYAHMYTHHPGRDPTGVGGNWTVTTEEEDMIVNVTMTCLEHYKYYNPQSRTTVPHTVDTTMTSYTSEYYSTDGESNTQTDVAFTETSRTVGTNDLNSRVPSTISDYTQHTTVTTKSTEGDDKSVDSVKQTSSDSVDLFITTAKTQGPISVGVTSAMSTTTAPSGPMLESVTTSTVLYPTTDTLHMEYASSSDMFSVTKEPTSTQVVTMETSPTPVEYQRPTQPGFREITAYRKSFKTTNTNAHKSKLTSISKGVVTSTTTTTTTTTSFNGYTNTTVHSSGFSSIKPTLASSHGEDILVGTTKDLGISTEGMSTPLSQIPVFCGEVVTERTATSFLISGRNSPYQGKWPWMVAILRADNVTKCGAVLVSSRYLVTAAHCIDGSVAAVATYRVLLGANNRDVLEPGRVYATIRRVILHSNFSFTASPFSITHDVGLIELDRAVTFTEYVQPLCLPEGTHVTLPLPGITSNFTSCYVTGFGYHNVDASGRSVSAGGTLQEQSVRLESISSCAWRYFSFYRWLRTSSNVCVRPTHNAKLCQGDSGSPLMCRQGSRWTLLGVASWSIRACISGNIPSIYVDLPLHADWIRQQINNQSESGSP